MVWITAAILGNNPCVPCGLQTEIGGPCSAPRTEATSSEAFVKRWPVHGSRSRRRAQSKFQGALSVSTPE